VRVVFRFHGRRGFGELQRPVQPGLRHQMNLSAGAERFKANLTVYKPGIYLAYRS
jgi:hypothetical protein